MTAAGPLTTTALFSGAPDLAHSGDTLAGTCFRELLHQGTIYATSPRDAIRGLPVASPSHLEMGAPASIATFQRCVALPYCFDFDAKQMICTVHSDVSQVVAEPFLHAAQRKYARAIVRISWASVGEILHSVRTNVQPAFVFSIGRCGSTLLHALARTFTPLSYSEPDPITQIALRPASELPAPEKQRLVWYALAPFLDSSGPDQPLIKFRAQVNPLAGKIVNSFPRAKYVFMFRERENWARSIYRTFGKSPGAAARRLARGLHAAGVISNSGASFDIVHYEDLVSSPLRVLTRVIGSQGTMRRAGDANAVAELLKQDSQSGTSLSRDKLTARADEDQWVQLFDTEWAKIRPDKLLRRLNLDL